MLNYRYLMISKNFPANTVITVFPVKHEKQSSNNTLKFGGCETQKLAPDLNLPDRALCKTFFLSRKIYILGGYS